MRSSQAWGAERGRNRDCEQHPAIGEDICAPLKSLRSHPAGDSGITTSEWMGVDIPMDLCGHEIPLMARMFQIADIYDALITHRPYRDALSLEDALKR